MNLKTNIPELDQEQEDLFIASEVLETLGNEPGMTTTEFYTQLLLSDIDQKNHERIFLAAIAIETMLLRADEDGYYTTH